METITTAFFNDANGKKAIESLGKSKNNLIAFEKPEIEQIELPENAIEKMFESDWLFINDSITAEQFIEKLLANDIDLFRLDEVRICVGGEAAADRLRLFQIHSDVIPVKNFSAEILKTLESYVGGEKLFRELNFYVPQSSEENLNLMKLIDKNGAEVLCQPFFQIKFTDPDLPKRKALLAGGAIDEFVFTAPEQIFYLRRLFNTENINEILFDIKCLASDETTRQSLIECGINSK